MGGKDKVIKDSLHGYIRIPEEIVDSIIDTPIFQRLNRIEQTSMRVLYPAARHDRFVHSIGTYYLGRKAYKYFCKNFKAEYGLYEEYSECWRLSFELACLLHDVGHSPFSHTLEALFKEKKYTIAADRIEPFIEYTLKNEMGKFFHEKYANNPENWQQDFESDYRRCSPAAHEIASAIVILNCYKVEIEKVFNADLELIIRAILGCTYGSPKNEKGVKNCIIRMLNSNIIDVDKLDYIARDSKLTGFDNVSIDTERLLWAVTAYKKGDDFYPAYNKNALSIIQNVLNASNSQQAWIVNHHVVVYNAHLIRTAIVRLAKLIRPKDYKAWIQEVFSIESIIGSKTISEKTTKIDLNMLCDDDLWFLLKNNMEKISEVKELLDRRIRKTAIWKSLAEFTVLFDGADTQGEFSFKKFSSSFSNACKAAENFGGFLNVNPNIPGYIDNINDDYLICSRVIEEFSKLHSYDSTQYVLLKGGQVQKDKAVISRDDLMIKFGFENKPYKDVMKYYQPLSQPSAPVDYFYMYTKETISRDQFVRFIKARDEFRKTEA